MSRRLVAGFCGVVALMAGAGRASAQGVDLTVFLGKAFPTYDERLTLRPPTPSLPGMDVTVSGSPLLQADGGPVFGAALAFELGVIGIEGRIDATDVALEWAGARYDLRGTRPPLQNLRATIIASEGRFDVDRIPLLSLNARIRTPGPVALVVSGGLSYLPDIQITGSVPLSVQASGLSLPNVSPRLTLRVTAGESEHRFGVNGGAGVRIGVGSVALMAEARVFYFREFELRFVSVNGPAILDDLLADIALVRFEPVFVNAQAGLVFRF